MAAVTFIPRCVHSIVDAAPVGARSERTTDSGFAMAQPDAQLLGCFALVDLQETINHIDSTHKKQVCWTLACQVGQVHSVTKFGQGQFVHGAPDFNACIESTQVFLIFAHTRSRFFFVGQPSFAGKVIDVRQGQCQRHTHPGGAGQAPRTGTMAGRQRPSPLPSPER